MTNINLQNISFTYGSKTSVFNNHSCQLAVEDNQKNKLYGIIGPRGVGKTTLLSILGGQLNPENGSVMVNDVDLYKVDDEARRQTVALHIQVATSMRGSLKYNLLFGLPYTNLEDDIPGKDVFSDKKLISVLQKVGLWDLFKEKDGLETLIGEGGLNLSGGQRQRLNFANVYIRSLYFEPEVILIDEPTSSLDEVSEMAITNMILQLAKKSVVFVIAHRLKTLDDAVGLLDMSLAKDTKDLIFYPHNQLKKISSYYKDLLGGKVTLDA